MAPFHEYIKEYKTQMEKGAIKKAYRGLMEFMMGLRTYFATKYPDCFVSGSIYFGYMDMTYFSVIPESLRQRKLKIAIVFSHDTFRFEVWLAANNKSIQSKYWNLVKKNNWNKYRIVPSVKGADSIIEHVLVDNPDFADLDNLTNRIETGTLEFIKDVEDFLAKTEP
ncbi:MAG: hypothetical protein GX638_07595 [Crenarchaeota archaeon]|nr:hypothetical protein [Thermoproteota archaeon]